MYGVEIDEKLAEGVDPDAAFNYLVRDFCIFSPNIIQAKGLTIRGLIR